MERARFGDIELGYEVTGAGEPVVFIHGAFIADATHFLHLESPAASRAVAEALAGYFARHPL
jgi:pimeloyl-ACP methyl ester carboxylesterase